MCVIKDADAIYHNFLMAKGEYDRSLSTLEGHLKTRSPEQLERLRKHAVEKNKVILLEKINELLNPSTEVTEEDLQVSSLSTLSKQLD